MELRIINQADAEAQWMFTTSQPANENGVTNPYHGVSFEEYKDKVLPTLIEDEYPNTPERVPQTYWYLWDKGCLVGEFKIRHYLSDRLRRVGGHIGYSIAKPYRNKGYGTEGLRLAVEIAKKIIPEDEIYLSVYKDNLASQKVMLKNGAYKAEESEDHFLMRIKKESGEKMRME